LYTVKYHLSTQVNILNTILLIDFGVLHRHWCWVLSYFSPENIYNS